MNLKYLRLNYLIQFVLVAIALAYFETLNNMFMAFLLSKTGYLAAILHKVLFYIYFILQLIIYILATRSNGTRINTILFLVMVSTPLLGWISIFNAFAFIYMTRKKIV